MDEDKSPYNDEDEKATRELERALGAVLSPAGFATAAHAFKRHRIRAERNAPEEALVERIKRTIEAADKLAVEHGADGTVDFMEMWRACVRVSGDEVALPLMKWAFRVERLYALALQEGEALRARVRSALYITRVDGEEELEGDRAERWQLARDLAQP